jgi:hypothetical protein
MISYDQIKKILQRHTHTVIDSEDIYITEICEEDYSALIDDLDDLYLEAFREGQKDPDYDR